MTKHEASAPTELEIKFCVPPGAEAALEAHPALQPAAPDRAETRQETTVYFDTPDCDLARNGAILRVRRRGDHYFQTLKLRNADGGPFGRGEWEWPVAADRPELELLAQTPAAVLLPAIRQLDPVFETEISRSVRTLRQDGSVIEVSLDVGTVRAGDAIEPVRELELELKEGDPAALYRLAVRLHSAVPLTLGAESKADRGWRLRTGRPRRAEKQAPLALADDVTGAEAFRRIVAATLANLLANEPAASAGDKEGVHQMRVGIRRLRAALVLFRPHLEPHATARFTAELRRLGQILGEARDWDVFCTETLPKAADNPGAASWLDLLRVPAEAERAAAHRRLGTEFDGPALTSIVLGLAAWSEDPGVLAAAGEGGRLRARLADLAPALERRLERKALRRGQHIRRLAPEELHGLRKALKKLRYGVEFLAPLHRRSEVKDYLRGCTALQKRLGAINDARVALSLAERLESRYSAELAPAAAALANWTARRQGRAMRRLPKAWRAFKSARLPR
jgi:triphosphatase